MSKQAAMSHNASLVRYRLAVASRVLAAFGGGYGLSAVFAAACGLVCVRWLGVTRADAVTLSTMLSFVVFTVAVLWAFACSSSRKAWLGIVVPAAVLGVCTWALYGGQA
nr:DUF3649 domain-containing protein [Comamonas avium]